MSKKILLVDGNLAVQKMIEMTLGKEGYVVACADNSLSALDIAIKARPDMILADSQLQGMRLEAFCQKLRHKERLNNVPLLLLINASDNLDERRLKSAGISGFIKKPIDPAELIEKVQLHMEDREEVMETVAIKIPSSLENSIPPPTPKEQEGIKKMEELLGWSQSGLNLFDRPSPGASDRFPSELERKEPSSEEALEETRVLPSFAIAEPTPFPASFAPVSGPQEAPAAVSQPSQAQTSSPKSGPDRDPQTPREGENGSAPSKTAPFPSSANIASQAEGITRELVEPIIREAVEQILWEIIPPIAEVEIKKAIEKLQQEA